MEVFTALDPRKTFPRRIQKTYISGSSSIYKWPITIMQINDIRDTLEEMHKEVRTNNQRNEY